MICDIGSVGSRHLNPPWPCSNPASTLGSLLNHSTTDRLSWTVQCSLFLDDLSFLIIFAKQENCENFFSVYY